MSMGHPFPVVRTSGVLIKNKQMNYTYFLLAIFHAVLTPEDSVFLLIWNTIDYEKKQIKVNYHDSKPS